MRTSITTSLFPTQISLEAPGSSFYSSEASEFSQNWWAYGLNYTNVFNFICNSEAGPVTPDETSGWVPTKQGSVVGGSIYRKHHMRRNL